MSSTRLPGKVLRPLAGQPMLLRQIERVARCRGIDSLVVATSDQASDDVLATMLADADVQVFRGDLNNVLGRFIGALDAFGPANHLVRLTGDCPLADWTVIDAVIDRHLTAGSDYASSTWDRRTFPIGLDAEVMTVDVLRQAFAEAREPYDREHVTPFIYRHPERFRIAGVTQAEDEGEVRWTVDRPDDFEFVHAVYEALYPVNPAFTSDDIRILVKRRPELARLGGDRRV